MKKLYKPGQNAKTSGQYPLGGPRDGDTGREVTVTKGEPFPAHAEAQHGLGQA